MNTDQEQIKDLNKSLAGWTVVRFDAIDHSEGFFAVTATRKGVTKTLEVWGNDCGFWTKEPRDTSLHHWVRSRSSLMDKNSKAICFYCACDKDSNKGKAPCTGV